MLIVRIGAVVSKPITVADIIRYDVVPFQMTLDFMLDENMTCFQLFLSLVFVGLSHVHSVTAADEVRDYFVFLTTGKSTQGIATEIIQQKQASHLENFGRLAKLGSLTAAGPCADPNKRTRGIVIIKAGSIADAESKFGPDPFVSEGYMNAELHQYEVIVGKLHLVTEVTSMEESVIVIVGRGPKWIEKRTQEELITSNLSIFAKGQFEEGKLGFAAQFRHPSNNDSGRIAVMIFRGKDIAAVRKTLEASELMRDELITFQAFPQYLVKGALGE